MKHVDYDSYEVCPFCMAKRLPNDQQPNPNLHACSVLYECGTELVFVIGREGAEVGKRCTDENILDSNDIKIKKVKVEPKPLKLKPTKPECTDPPPKPEDFYTHHLVNYNRDAVKSWSWTSVEVLPFLKGKPWDSVALAYVHALRPSSIRVTEGCCTLDGRTWRVTVFVDKNNIITEIEQEVEVALPEDIQHGEHLQIALKYGIDSPQSNWYKDDTIEGFVYADKYYKNCKDGLVPFPKEDEN